MKTTIRQQMHDTIIDLCKQWHKKRGMSPTQINNGYCHVFAKQLLKKFPTGDVIWGDDDPHHTHCSFFVDELYFDAECPKGVPNHDELPLYNR